MFKLQVQRRIILYLTFFFLVITSISIGAQESMLQESLERGRQILNNLPSLSRKMEDWSYPLPSLGMVLSLEKREGIIPSYWSLQVPLNLGLEDLKEVIDAITHLFPPGIVLLEKDLQGPEPFIHYGFFFLMTHSISITRPHLKGRLAIVIDDLGEVSAKVDAFKDIPFPLTMSVLPQLPNSYGHAQKVLEMGHDLLLHQPMEPFNQDLDPGPGAIYVDMGEEEIKRVLKENLSSLPKEVIGVNNHMGSKATQDERVMKIVLDYLKNQRLFFLDSSTVIDSVVPALSLSLKMPLLVNRLFIDNLDEYGYIMDMLVEATSRVKVQGDMIVIGHARVNTAKAIKDSLSLFEEEGVLLILLSQLF